jgi:hypothetical protein
VPLRVAGLARAGALSLRLRMTGRALAFREVTSQVPGIELLANRVGDEIRVEWLDRSAGASPPAIGDGTLLTLGFEATGAAGDSCLLEWSAASAVGDPQGAPIAGITWTGGRVRIGDPAAATLGRFALHPIAPNPVAIRSALRFTLPRPGRARLDLFDVNGRLVRTLLDGALEAGDHTADFDGRDAHGARLVSGVYVVRLGAAGETRSRKLVLMP